MWAMDIACPPPCLGREVGTGARARARTALEPLICCDLGPEGLGGAGPACSPVPVTHLPSSSTRTQAPLGFPAEASAKQGG